MTFYQGLRIKTRPQLKKNGKPKRKHYITSKTLDEFAKAVKFNKDGSMELPYFSFDGENSSFFWYSQGRQAVSHTYNVKKEETFTSVFRGTYIVQFTNDNGQTSDVYGVNSWED